MRRTALLARVTLALPLTGPLSEISVAQGQAALIPPPQQEEEPFTLDLPDWNPDPEDLPPGLRPLDVERPVLPEGPAEEVAELEARIAELEKHALTAETRENRDAALDEAIAHARRALEIRTVYQGNTDYTVHWRDAEEKSAVWHELLSSRQKVEYLNLLRRLTPATRAELGGLYALEEEISRLDGASRYAEAQELAERHLSVCRRVLGDDHPRTLNSMGWLGHLLLAQGYLAEADPLWRELTERSRQVLGNDHPRTLSSINNLGSLLVDHGRPMEAEPYVREALEGGRKILGDEHPHTLLSINNLGALLNNHGRPGEAEPYFRMSLNANRSVLGDEHPQTILLVNNLGSLLMSQGRLAEAEPYVREALNGSRRVHGSEHAATLATMQNLGALVRAQGRQVEAEPHYREALEGRRRLLGEAHPDTLNSINSLGALLDAQGRSAEAELYYREALQICRRVLGDDHQVTMATLNNLGVLLEARGASDEAELYLREALNGHRRRFGNEHRDTLASMYNLGVLLLGLRRPAEAEPYYREALEGRRQVMGDEHQDTLISSHGLGAALLAQGRPAEAEPYYRKALEIRRVVGSEHPDVLYPMGDMGHLYETQGRYAEAEPYYRKALALSERLRVRVIGGAQERAQFASILGLREFAAAYARTLVALDRGNEALSVLERGRSRAGLDLMAGGSAAAESLLRESGDAEAMARYEAAVTDERAAMRAVFEAEARMAATSNEEKAECIELVKAARQGLSEQTAAVFKELRGLVPVSEPANSEEVLAALRGGEALLSYSWEANGAMALVARGGEVRGVILAKDESEATELGQAVNGLREHVAKRPSADEDVLVEVLAAAREGALPEELRALLSGVSALVVIADGPFAGVPLDLILPDIPISYAPSATIAIQRPQAEGHDGPRDTSAVVLGDPVFGRSEREQPDYPETGVLLSVVQEGSNASRSGLRRGDVILIYDVHELSSVEDLDQAIAVAAEVLPSADVGSSDRSVPVAIWREGEVLEVMLTAGQAGVVPSLVPPAEGLRSMAALDRSAQSLASEVSALEQVQLYGRELRRLPATRLEAETVVSLLGENVTLLLGKDASVPRLRKAIGAIRPRVVHLATHGLLGTTDRPLLASLALSTPHEPSPEDIGFLTLEEILGTLGPQLKGSEMITLSACDTGRGVQRGDTMMSLPLGLLIAGAETVVASLWSVDDRATALLMARFYANWLGRADSEREIDGVHYVPREEMPKLAALREAQAWLRNLSAEDRERLSGLEAKLIAEESTRSPSVRGIGPEEPAAELHRPYAHPYYWAAFVLYGDPR